MNAARASIIPACIAMAVSACQQLPPLGTIVASPSQATAQGPMLDGAASSLTEEGIASWYGEDFHGRLTASGDVYDMYAMTAAHRTLPLGTRVRVTNTANARSVAVLINDRGPFKDERIVDLSYAAASDLGMIGPGTVPVRVEVMSLGQGKAGVIGERAFTVQVGAFRDPANAGRLVATLAADYPDARVIAWFNGRETVHRVRIGGSLTMDEAAKRKGDLSGRGYEAVILRDDAK